MEHSEKSTPTERVSNVSSPATPSAGSQSEHSIDNPPPKTLSFYLSFVSLNLLVFIVSVDATALGVAIPVCTYYDGTHESR
jgi:hypothetical protein